MTALFLLVALAGACTMIVELSAVRLVAPWFGASTGVWTNVIGVILLALSVGYLAGARLAAGRAPARSLAYSLLFSALFTAWLPFLAKPACSWFMPEGIALDQAAGLFLWGSLGATLLLFAAPAVCLGCIGPLAVEVAAQREHARAGTAGGQVLCASTLGSLAGTFATTHVLLPRIGVSWTLLSAGIGLAGAGAVFLLKNRRAPHGATVLILAGIAAAAWGSRVEPPALPEGLSLLDRAESSYQTLRVVEDLRSSPRLRLLQVNEGLDSFQSVWTSKLGLIGEGYYYDYFALPAWWSRASGSWRVVVLGLGAGTAFRVLEGASPPGLELELSGVEIDSRAVELGRRWFELQVPPTILDPRLAPRARPRVLAGWDARTALRSLPNDFDLAVLDAYAHQVEIPAHLSTLEFLREVRSHLAPGGWLAINVGGFSFQDPVVEAVASTAAAAFERPVLGVRVPRSRNFVLFARRDQPPLRPGQPGFSFEGEVGRALVPLLLLPSAWSWYEPGRGTVLTDDRNPLDRLQRKSLETGRARLRTQS